MARFDVNMKNFHDRVFVHNHNLTSKRHLGAYICSFEDVSALGRKKGSIIWGINIVMAIFDKEYYQQQVSVISSEYNVDFSSD